MSDNDFGAELSNNEVSFSKKGGYRPELYTVVAGAYASNAVYAMGSPLVHSYYTNQLAPGTTTVTLGAAFVTSKEGCEWEQIGSDVTVTCNVTLGTTANPGFGAEELRIKPLRRNSVEPKSYLRGLPTPFSPTEVPILTLEIVNKSGVQIVPDAGSPAGNYKLGARVLGNGTIALIVRDFNAAPPNAWRGITHDDIAANFVADQVISFSVHGSYSTR